jgi:hypothetical protein
MSLSQEPQRGHFAKVPISYPKFYRRFAVRIQVRRRYRQGKDLGEDDTLWSLNDDDVDPPQVGVNIGQARLGKDVEEDPVDVSGESVSHGAAVNHGVVTRRAPRMDGVIPFVCDAD